jgi:hypothetical protein
VELHHLTKYLSAKLRVYFLTRPYPPVQILRATSARKLGKAAAARPKNPPQPTACGRLENQNSLGTIRRRQDPPLDFA